MDARYLRIATWSSVDGNIYLYLYLVRISSGYGLREIKRNNRFKRVNLAWHDQNRFTEIICPILEIFSSIEPLKSATHSSCRPITHTGADTPCPAQQPATAKLSRNTRQPRQTSQTTYAKSAGSTSMARVVWQTHLAKARCTASATHV